MRIAGYNWPLSTAAGIGIAAGAVAACLSALPPAGALAGGAGAVVAGLFAAASFWAFHSMFDRSEPLGGRWLTEEIPQLPNRWVQVTAGLEETTLPVVDVFPAAEGKTLDLYNPAVMTEPAVRRARENDSHISSVAMQPDASSVDDGWGDLVVVPLAAHEIRDGAKRKGFFHELRRIVSPVGRVVVVEHLRNLPTALAYGPGILHFYPRGEWLRLGKLAGTGGATGTADYGEWAGVCAPVRCNRTQWRPRSHHS